MAISFDLPKSVCIFVQKRNSLSSVRNPRIETRPAIHPLSRYHLET